MPEQVHPTPDPGDAVVVVVGAAVVHAVVVVCPQEVGLVPG